MESRDQDRRILPISIVKVLVEDGTDVIASTVQTADTIVNAEKRQTAVAARRGVTAEYPPALCGRCQIR